MSGGKKTVFVSCDEGHGRLLWMGHVKCTTCGREYRKKPEACTVGRRVDGVIIVCGCEVFEVACAKCFASNQRLEAASSSFPELGELGSAGYE